ncbi:MAG TPA: hypothetical protein VKW06_05820 [Candidatus Angelobacter sp.]|nr:hypothetical protein [Candidatus Angelobacter sp.]
MKSFLLCAACLVCWLGANYAQECKKTEYSAEQQKYLDDAVQKFASCGLPLDDGCRITLAQAMEQIYGVKDFGSGSRYMTPAEITKKVSGDTSWEHVGNASDQNALKTAQSSANCGKAVIAVLASDTGGHVALILPGAVSPSGMWKLDVPKSASFFTHSPSKSFAGKPLSFSFPSPQNVELYAKK